MDDPEANRQALFRSQERCALLEDQLARLKVHVATLEKNLRKSEKAAEKLAELKIEEARGLGDPMASVGLQRLQADLVASAAVHERVRVLEASERSLNEEVARLKADAKCARTRELRIESETYLAELVRLRRVLAGGSDGTSHPPREGTPHARPASPTKKKNKKGEIPSKRTQRSRTPSQSSIRSRSQTIKFAQQSQ